MPTPTIYLPYPPPGDPDRNVVAWRNYLTDAFEVLRKAIGAIQLEADVPEPRLLGLPVESLKTPLGSTRLFAYHQQARRLFVSQNDGGSHFSIWERRGNRWNFVSDPNIPSAGNDNVTLLVYVHATQRIWFSDENSEEIYELDADGNVTNTFAMPGCLKLRSGDMAYIDVFPADATTPYVFLFNDGGEIYRMLTDGSVDLVTSGLDCKQLVMRRNYGNRFTRGYFVRSTGDVSRIETDLTVSDPAGLAQGMTGIPAGQEYCGSYNDLWDRLVIIPEGTGDVYSLDVTDSGTMDTFDCQASLGDSINSSENAPFNYTGGRLMLTSDGAYLEMGRPSVVTGLEASRFGWDLVDGTAPKNIIYIDHNNGLADQWIREAVVADGSRFHVIR